jgi:type II secretory pathway pseudopilin PulG
MKLLPKRPHSSGFTMIELLVVTTIIIVLTAVGLVSYQSAMRNARNGKRKADLESVRSALVLYRTDIGRYPIENTYDDMLDTLGDYLTNPPQDPKVSQDPNLGTQTGYTYISATGTTFTLCARLEPNPPGQLYCLMNP